MPIAYKIAKIMEKNQYTNFILQIIKPWYLKGYLNIFKTFSRYSIFRLYKHSIFHRFSYPSTLYIFLTTKCNLQCFICSRTYNNYIGSDFDFKILKKIKNAIKYAKIIDLTGWGEATIYFKFPEVLEYIYSINPNKNLICLITNGTRLSEKTALLLNNHLHSLTISLNAATEETYNRDMKNGDFLKTITNIKKFMAVLNIEERKKITLHFVAHTENFKEIPAFVELAHGLGILSITIGQYLISYENHKQFSLLNIKDEYNTIITIAEAKGKELNVRVNAQKFSYNSYQNKIIHNLTAMPCLSPFNECFISVEGNVGVCCFAGNEIMGNVLETEFESIWFGEKYHKLRNHRFFKACQTCVPSVSFDDPMAHLTIALKK